MRSLPLDAFEKYSSVIPAATQAVTITGYGFGRMGMQNGGLIFIKPPFYKGISKIRA
jgi:hypothetical protein